ncbi:TIM-barrel domain-containing protein [Flavivirga sp. 57AJ16]|uniref:TIM-barrel domain-containing protein n=1 Tax=Flavivirga sp. 57AJ16 TaxID=3025307 RepID=UPI00236652F2|nr:TIM-barrel domain-containing protein [Flavivirga sp. 57AJ16]MDD7885386.1 glycoside hydrolase family 31 protein [Flavivirga sp. 57AJ16]
MNRIIITSLFCISLFNSINAQQSVVIDGNAKFTVLSPILIRTEYSGDGIFETKKSFNITNLDLPVPAYTSQVNNGWLEIQTEKLFLRYKQNSGSFDPSNLIINLNVKGQSVEAKPWPLNVSGYKIEAENTSLFGGAHQATDHSGNTGPGFVAGLTTIGAGMEWNLNTKSVRDYALSIKYANGMGNDRTISLYIDNVKTQITLAQTANWDSWHVFRKNISLTEGHHVVKIVCETNDSYNINVDWLELNPVSKFKEICEAENTTLLGSTKSTDHNDYSGSGFIAGLDKLGSSIIWGINNELSSGNYTISLRYANGQGGDGQHVTRTISLYVNGVKTQISLPKTANWDTWAVFQKDVSFNTGINTVKISCDPGDTYNVNVDWLAVSAIGDPLPSPQPITQKTNLGGGARSLDVKGGEIPLWDGLMSQDGWYLIDDSKTALIDPDGWVSNRSFHPGGSQDGYFFGYGTDYQTALKDFYKITGNPPLLPKWAFGVWYSKYEPYTSSFYETTLLPKFRAEKVPLDALVVDTDWKSPHQWNGWSWNGSLFPDPQSFINWGQQEGLAIGLNIHPSIQNDDPMFGLANATAGGLTGNGRYHFDFSNKNHAKAYFDLHKSFNEQGIDFWWLDWVDGEISMEVKGLPQEAWLSHLYTQNRTARGMRGFAFSRIGNGFNGYGDSGVPDMAWSDHRYSLHFTGDTFDEWNLLKFASTFTISEGNLGIPYISHDIGSFKGRTLTDDKYIRWLQFGTFQPIFRLHSDDHDDSYRLPWQYPNVEEQAKDFIRLRHALVPYTYSLAYESSTGGLPIVRGMYFYYPEMPQAYAFDKQYFYGEHILVSPIVTAGEVASTEVWFPEGKWTHFFTNEIITGPTTKTISANYSTMPVFVKAGGIIPLKSYSDFVRQKVDNELTLKVYAGADGDFTLYEDEGDNLNYKVNQFALTNINYNNSQKKLTIGAQQGNYVGSVQNRSYDIVLYNATTPTKIFLNNNVLNNIEPNSGEGWWVDNEIIYIHLDESSVLEDKIISLDESLSLQDEINKQKVKLFPNPVIKSFFFNTDISGANVRVFSPTGILVLEQKVDSNNSVDMSKLSTGIYFVIANKNHENFTIKVIKE